VRSSGDVVVFVVVLVFAGLLLWVGSLVGSPFVCSGARHGRHTQQCEVVGRAHECLRYSARGSSGQCWCTAPSGARIEYRNTYGRER